MKGTEKPCFQFRTHLFPDEIIENAMKIVREQNFWEGEKIPVAHIVLDVYFTARKDYNHLKIIGNVVKTKNVIKEALDDIKNNYRNHCINREEAIKPFLMLSLYIKLLPSSKTGPHRKNARFLVNRLQRIRVMVAKNPPNPQQILVIELETNGIKKKIESFITDFKTRAITANERIKTLTEVLYHLAAIELSLEMEPAGPSRYIENKPYVPPSSVKQPSYKQAADKSAKDTNSQNDQQEIESTSQLRIEQNASPSQPERTSKKRTADKSTTDTNPRPAKRSHRDHQSDKI